MSVAVAESAEDRAACLAIRHAVFVVEQAVPEDLERDGRDSEAVHLLGRVGGAPAGTLRIRRVDGAAKLERVAVLPAHRGTGLGVALTEAAVAAARGWGLTRVKLSAQVPVIGFYERLGFVARGDVYEDAGIPHRDMDRAL